MKRFWLFQGDDYYPSGGMGDFCGDFDSVEEAKELAGSSFFDDQWSQVFDCEAMKVVAMRDHASERIWTRVEADPTAFRGDWSRIKRQRP